MKPLSESIGERIKNRRKELNIKQQDLAEAVGVSNNHISGVENGSRNLSIKVLVKICEQLNITPDYVLLGSLHGYNIPQDITDKLRLCSQDDIEFISEVVDLLIKKHWKNEP